LQNVFRDAHRNQTRSTLPDDIPPIVSASVFQVSMPLKKPFITGFGPTATRNTVLVRIVDDDGMEGWGEAPALDHPFYLPETTSTTYAIVTEYALPLALAAGDARPAAVVAAMSGIRGNAFACAGVEAAFWALQSQRDQCPIRDMIGAPADRIPVGESVSITDTLDETLAEIALRLREGFRRIKLKIRPGWDVELVREVRAAFGDDILLQVDANAVYTFDDAGIFVALDEFGLLCIEQPLGFDDMEGSARLQKMLRTPICLDEAIRSPKDVERALDMDACRNVNLKPPRVGGITEARRIHDMCLQRGVPLWGGGMLESGIGRATNLALCALPGFTQPADMSPASILFTEDLVEPTFTLDPDGYIAVPTTPGVGFPVATERVFRRTVRWATLDRSSGRLENMALDALPRTDALAAG
jgi:o-succinylbenzoate synthase